MVSKVTPLENPLLEAALEYVERGWPVFPCEARGKRPLTPHGFKDATTDVAAVRAWWRRWPRANVAIPTGTRTFDVLDVDGSQGEQSLAALEARHDELPAGPRQITGTGRHLLFRGGTLGVSARRLPGLDTRGDGGYVIVAPSIHPSGERYALEDDDAAIPEPPAWLVSELRAGSRDAMGEDPAGPAVHVDDANGRMLLEMCGFPLHEIGEGTRDETLFKRACSLRAQGQDFNSILNILRLANKHLCKPLLPDEQIVAKVRSAMRYEPEPQFRREQDRIERKASEAALAESVRERAGSKDRSELVATLQQMLGVPLSRVIRFGAKPTRYYLVFGEESRVMVTDLLSYSAVKKAVLDHAGAIVSVRQKQWDHVALMLRSIAEEEDAEIADVDGETLHYLQSFVSEASVSEDAQDEESVREMLQDGAEVVHFGGRIHFQFDAFCTFCDRRGLREPLREMWRRLRESNVVTPTKVTFRDKNSRVRSIRYWSMKEMG